LTLEEHIRKIKLTLFNDELPTDYVNCISLFFEAQMSLLSINVKIEISVWTGQAMIALVKDFL